MGLREAMAREQPALTVRSQDAETLYQAHVRPIYGFLVSRVGSREAAEDLTSEVFLRALSHLDPSREEHSIVAWLYRVARNAVNDYWRAGRGAQVISLDQVRVVRTNPPPPDLVRQDQ